MDNVIINDPQKHHIVIMGSPCKLLAGWLIKHYHRWRISPKVGYAVDVDRNQAIMHFLYHEKECTHMIMLDHDMIPLPHIASLEELFKARPHDLVSCGYRGTAGTKGHYGDGDLGASSFRVSRTLLEKMGAPWFKTTYSEDLTQRLDCECNHFAKRAKDCGVSTKQVGVIGHQQGGDGGMIVIPNLKNRAGYSHIWPHEYKI